MYCFLYLVALKSTIFTEFTVFMAPIIEPDFRAGFKHTGAAMSLPVAVHVIQSIVWGKNYAAELSRNESEHVSIDSHSSFSLALVPRKFGRSW